MDEYNRRAAELADQLGDYPDEQNIQPQVAAVLKWDDLYRKELAKRKYLQENRMLPADEPVKQFQQNYQVPTAGLELGLAMRNLSKNVSVWKKRIGDGRYPEAENRHGMYTALYNEAKTKAAAERARIQSLANESDNNN